jgi:hypothetical protein
MDKNQYPDISYPEVYKVQTVFMQHKKDPEYINKSPYSEAVKTSLSSMFERITDTEERVQAEDLVDLDLEEETNLVYTRTKQLMNKSLATNEELTVLKSAAGLLEKLLGMAERAKNLRYIRDLEQKIIKIAQTMPEESRSELLNMLKE